jgi:chromosome segregation ATPase
MRGSEARRPIPEARVNENPMEARVAALETDVRNIKENVAKLFDGMKAANDGLTKLLTGQAELRGDIDGLRGELKSDVQGLRAELKSDMHGLRTELKGDIQGLRTELKGDIQSLRTEVRGDIGTLRAEMGTLRAEVKGQLDALEGKIQRWFVATSISCAGLAFAAVKLFQ